MQHTDAALASHGDGHPALGDGVHRCGGDRDVQLDVARELGRGVHGGRDDLGSIRDQKDVVESEPGESDLVRIVAPGLHALGCLRVVSGLWVCHKA